MQIGKVLDHQYHLINLGLCQEDHNENHCEWHTFRFGKWYQRWKNPIGFQFHNGMQTKDAFLSSQQGEGEGALGWDYDKLLSWKHGHVKLHTKKKKAYSVVCSQIGAWVVHKSLTPTRHTTT
jgi:hypothetical protein